MEEGGARWRKVEDEEEEEEQEQKKDGAPQQLRTKTMTRHEEKINKQ